MCTRMTLKTPGDELGGILVADAGGLEGRQVTKYNIAPTDPVVAMRAEDAGGTVSRALSTMRWGLVPPWADDLSIGARMVNARMETAHSRRAFRRAFRKGRCIVVADGFFEWERRGRERLPHHFRRRDERPLLLAGLWARWTPIDEEGNNGEPVFSCAVLTRDAEGSVARVHDRMPVALDDPAPWLTGTQDVDRLRAVLATGRLAGSDAVESFRVDPWMNNVRHQGPRCIEPVATQSSLF